MADAGPLLTRVGVCVAALLLAACRDATRPVEIQDRPPATDLPRQLTFSTDDERAPAWSPAGDSLWYSVRGIPPFAEIPGLLLSVSAQGGEAVPLMPDLQLGGARATPVAGLAYDWLTAAVPAPGDDRVAYVDLTFVWPTELCLFVTRVQCVPESDPTVPRLRNATVRIRGLDGFSPVVDEPALPLSFEGRRIIPPPPFSPPRPQGLWAVTHHPSQHLFTTERSAVFRPSWAPGADQLVFSDGLRLLRWAGSGAPEPIPGTEDGVLAAWSPDGAWIAFTRLGRGEPIRATCEHLGGPRGPPTLQCEQERVAWPLTGRTVEVVRPDGSDGRVLWEGDEPAWTPGGQALVFRRAGRLWLGRLEDGSVREIPGTAGGREPAVSPDGRLLAFTRPAGPSGSFDLWVTTLPLP